MSTPVARRLVVSGRVQGVGYRASCAAAARRLGLTGRVRNLPDGRVEVLVAGEEAVVAALVDWCRQGPPAGRVTSVEVTDWPEPLDAAAGFVVTA